MRLGVLRRGRSRAQTGVLLAVGAWVLVLAAVVSGLVGYLSAATASGVRQAWDRTPPVEAALEIGTRLADDPAEQSAAVDELAAEAFGDIPMRLHRSLRGGAEQITATGTDGVDRADGADPAGTATGAAAGTEETRRAVLAAYGPEFTEQVHLVDGAWPSTPPAVDAGVTPAALHVGAAEALGIGPGDTVTVEAGVLKVVATWQPLDPADPFWFGDVVESTGVDGQTHGPFVVAESALTAVEDAASVRWRLWPDAAAIEREHLAGVTRGAGAVTAAVEDDPRVDVRGVRVNGGMAATAESVEAEVARSLGVTGVPLVILLAIAAVAGVQVVRLLTMARESETTLLRSRGATAAQMVAWSGLEALVVVVPSALGGAALSAVVLRSSGADGFLPAVVGSTAVVILTATALVVMVTAAAVRRRVQDTVAFTARRAGGAVSWSLAAVAVIAAVVSVWQLSRYGESGAGGSPGGADLLATPGPALALLACAGVALLTLPPVLAPVERALSGSGRLRLLMPAWQVTRRLPVHAAVVVLVTVTAGSGVLAAAYAGTWTALQGEVAALRTGTDVRVILDRAGPVSAARPVTTAAEFSRLDGADVAVPVMSTNARIGDQDAGLLALPAVGIAAVAGVRADLFDADDVAEKLTAGNDTAGGAEAGGVVLPPDTRRIELDTTTSGELIAGMAPDGTVVVEPASAMRATSVWLADGSGVLTSAPVVRGSAELPSAFAAERLVGIEVESPGQGRVAFSVDALRMVDGSGAVTTVDPDTTGPWAAGRRTAPETATVGPTAMSLQADTARAGSTIRLVVPAGPVPVVATGAALQQFGLGVGDRVTLQMFGGAVDAEVAGTTTVIPGIDDPVAFVADLPALNAALLASQARLQRIDEVWLGASGSPSDLAHRVDAADLSTAASVVDREKATTALLGVGMARQAVLAFWAVAAASVVLTVIGAVASSVMTMRQRAGELAVLRAVGVDPADQAHARRIEQLTLGAVALVIGAGGGALIAIATTGVLSRAATAGVPAALDPAWRVTGGSLLVFGAALAAILIVVATSHAARVRRGAASAVPGQSTAGRVGRR